MKKEHWNKLPVLDYYYSYYYYLGIPQQRESFSLIEGVSTDRYKSVEAQLLCMWDGAI